MDMRARALAAVDGSMSRRAAAGRFGVSISSVIRWDAVRRETGSFAPRPQGGDTRSRRIEAQHGVVIAALEEERDQSLEELCARLAARGVVMWTSTLSRFFTCHGLTRKNTPACSFALQGPEWLEVILPSRRCSLLVGARIKQSSGSPQK